MSVACEDATARSRRRLRPAARRAVRGRRRRAGDAQRRADPAVRARPTSRRRSSPPASATTPSVRARAGRGRRRACCRGVRDIRRSAAPRSTSPGRRPAGLDAFYEHGGSAWDVAAGRCCLRPRGLEVARAARAGRAAGRRARRAARVRRRAVRDRAITTCRALGRSGGWSAIGQSDGDRGRPPTRREERRLFERRIAADGGAGGGRIPRAGRIGFGVDRRGEDCGRL